MSLKSILFPVVSPDQMKKVLPSVARTANKLRASLTLLRVVDPFRDGGPKPVLQEFGSLKPEEYGLDRCHVQVNTHSDAAASIAQYVQEQKIDTIMLPSSGGGLRSAFSRHESSVHKLLAQSQCPVWLMNDSSQAHSSQQDVRRVLCAVSGRDLPVLKTAAEVSKALGAKLFLLHVVPEVHEGTLAFGFDEHVALSVENGLELLSRLQGDAGTQAQPLVQVGSVKDTIRQVAKTLHIDLVVTGRRQLKSNSWLEGWQSRFAPALSSQTLIV